MPPDSWTILRVLNWTTNAFRSHHIERPRSDAEILLSHALGLRRVDLYIQYDRPLEPEELSLFKTFVARRLEREPVAYIVGVKGFWTLDLAVPPDVLIPRPETEHVVETALSAMPVAPTRKPWRILDLGTGCGAIVLALATERPGHRYYGADRSAGAVRAAAANARKCGLGPAVRFFQGDWFKPICKSGPGFDMIVSNPPYVASADLETLAPEVSRYEPRFALDGGPDGLDAIRMIVHQAPGYLKCGGYLVMEIGYDQAKAVTRLIGDVGAYQEARVIRDYSGLDRVVTARKNNGGR